MGRWLRRWHDQRPWRPSETPTTASRGFLTSTTDRVTPRCPTGQVEVDLHLVDHPLAKARLTTLRDERTDNAAFRAALSDLTMMLIYEATRDAACEPVPVRTPLADTTGSRLANPPLLVPVLRAGLGMVDQAHALIPE